MYRLAGLLSAINPDLPVTNQDLQTVPTGRSYDAANSYYHWLWGDYIVRWYQPWKWNLSEAFLQQWTVALTLIGFFWVFAFHFNQSHRDQKELYKPIMYGGAVTERHGKWGPASIVYTAAIALWAAYYPINHILLGQIY